MPRRVRRQCGFTLGDLARQTGLTEGCLSKVGRRQRVPSLSVASKIARALNIDVAQLFSERCDEKKITVDRAADRGSDFQRYRAVAAGPLGKSMPPFVLRPNDRAAPILHPSHCDQEFIFVHSGTVELEYGDRNLTLAAGDSAYLDASIGHAIYAVRIEIPEVIAVASGEASPTVELRSKWLRQTGVVENPKKGQLCSQPL